MSDSGHSGVGAAVFVASWLMRTLGLEVLSFGRPATAKYYECELQLSGRHLLYIIRLDHNWLLVSAALMDKGDAPEFLGSPRSSALGSIDRG
jgi:hypothetical protein